MILYIQNHGFHFEMENLCRLYFPHEKITRESEFLKSEEDYVLTRVSTYGENILIEVEAKFKTSKKYDSTVQNVPEANEESERLMAVMLYTILSEFCSFSPPWGILTGVRPAKLMGKLIKSEGEEKAKAYFRNALLVSPPKTELAAKTALNGAKIPLGAGEKSFSLYIAIPFCPTRCSYCSFISQSAPSALNLIPRYISLLCEEIRFCGELARKNKLKLESIYIGGGTPTILDARQLFALMGAVEESFDIKDVPEYTVEAGRPDTITEEKLRVLKDLGADRISINPQTVHDHILENIGRHHTTAQTFEALELAKNIGFRVLNTDLIAGLPGDTPDGFHASIAKMLSYEPENITVHTLALKRSASISSAYDNGMTAAKVGKMLDICSEKLSVNGYEPYYMYRQTRSVGNFENVGYAKPGFEGLYNIYMMDELHTVIGCGAGGVTKLKRYGANEIIRIFNHKYPYEYISRFDELISRKSQVNEFYDRT